MTLWQQWRAAATLLIEGRALLAERQPSVHTSPWSAFLLGLDDNTVDLVEGAGIDAVWPSAAPADLLAFTERIRAVIDLPLLDDDLATPSPARRHERPHKQLQIDAFVRAAERVGEQALRFVDVGSGHGHLTRALAVALRRPGIGLEYNPALVDRALALAAAAANDVAFVVSDVVGDSLVVHPGDCLVGLHACGELGDLVVRAAADSAVDSAVVFVGCCLQKQRALVRAPLCSDDDVDMAALHLPKGVLGLSNLSTTDDGVEASRAVNVAARRQRLAVKILLERAGIIVEPNTEVRGVNRRAVHEPLAEVVRRVFAYRGVPLPSIIDVNAALIEATSLHMQQRRLALPRWMLARVLEVFVALDRALFLQQHGFRVEVGVLFSSTVSPRNLAVVARRRG